MVVNTLSEPHPKLIPLLEKHGISHADFVKKGRPSKGTGEMLVSARRAIITELHAQGTSWAEMIEVTGLGNASVQRLTGAMWNPESRKRSRDVGVRVGKSWKGKHRPGQLNRQWAAGNFENLRGRTRSELEKQHLRDGWTPTHRQVAGEHSLRLWSDPEIRAKLMEFHLRPEERAKRSQLQAQRMKDYPQKYIRGVSTCVETPKGFHLSTLSRSSYETAAIIKLEADPTVLRYEHERVLKLPTKHWILPDFIIEYEGGRLLLVEVKASWVLSLPEDDRRRKRLAIAQDFATAQGWDFAIWTEKELGC